MSISQFIKLVEELGIPLLTAGVAAYALWFILKWLLVKFSTDFNKQLEKGLSEVDEEIRDTRDEIHEIKTLVVRLIDRVRLLDQSLLEHDAVARTIWNLEPKLERPRTRAERREELEEELRNIGKNGDS
jgi:predicted RNase H-like nuclease (RuvC/YqgF family)